MDQKPPDDRKGLDRRSFLTSSAAAAAGAAAVATPAALALAPGEAGQKRAVVTDPSSPTPREPVVAYVRDAGRGEVTVLSGTTETTYRDPALAKRLLAASEHSLTTGGGVDVIAP